MAKLILFGVPLSAVSFHAHYFCADNEKELDGRYMFDELHVIDQFF